MRVVIGSDSDGMRLKEVIKKDLIDRGFTVVDKVKPLRRILSNQRWQSPMI